MKTLISLLFVSLLAAASFAAPDIKTGDDVIAAMFKKYEGKWYKTLTFEQKTTDYDAEGKATVEQWYEALSAPGKLRIDQEPIDKRGGILFADGKIYQYAEMKPATGRPFVHPLLVLGFDVYMQPVATTITQLKGMGMDMSVVHEDKWQGANVYVVGAKQGELNVNQFWVDKKTLLFVRMIQMAGRDRKIVAETQFNKYVKSGGGWVAAEVKFFRDGKPTTLEEYSNIRSGMKLDENLWNPEKWYDVQLDYWKKK